jgi:serine-type D-Ala-D-Ala carboxypeptidase/endopeptidase (penicillin-binding protein 4)
LTRRAAREREVAVGKNDHKRGTTPTSPAEKVEPAKATVKGGLGGFIAKHPAAWLAATLGVVFLMLGTGAVLAGAAVGNNGLAAGASPSNSAQAGRAKPPDIPAASHLRTCSVADLAADPRLATFSGSVMNAATGELMFDRSGALPARTGSLLKLITAAAALAILGPDYRLSTRVLDGSLPGTIVLVGGGDPTISQLPTGQESVYIGAAKLDDLAEQTQTAYNAAHPGVPITKIVLDATLWNSADNWDASWKRTEQTKGNLSEVTALQVDGDRADPTKQTSPRSTDPIGRAGQLFEDAMGLSGVTFSLGSAVASKPVLGMIQSQPMSTLVNQMLVASDGTLAETIARVVSKNMGFDGSEVSLQEALVGALSIYGVSTTGLTIHDGSGLSELNAVPPQFFTKFLIAILGQANNLNIVYDSLAVAGSSGSLAKRFSGPNAVARKNVVAKTGFIDSEYSLAGIVTAADGTQLTFAFYAIKAGIKDTAQAALDTLTTGVYNCGDNLANN